SPIRPRVSNYENGPFTAPGTYAKEGVPLRFWLMNISSPTLPIKLAAVAALGLGCAAATVEAPFPARPDTTEPGDLRGPFDGRVAREAPALPRRRRAAPRQAGLGAAAGGAGGARDGGADCGEAAAADRRRRAPVVGRAEGGHPLPGRLHRRQAGRSAVEREL